MTSEKGQYLLLSVSLLTMRHLNNLEFEISYRIEELIIKHGLMSIDDPRVAWLFKNLATIKKLKQIAYQLNPDYLAKNDGATDQRGAFFGGPKRPS